jgi:DNA-binding transcriptional LysR family regulator
METITPRFDWSMTFLAVAECSGFSAAATQLGLSKAYVSKQVLQLEQELGVTLLYRTTRRVTLTEAGRQYLGYCRQLRETMEQARRAIGSLHAEVSGRIRLSAPVSLGVAFIGDMLLAFRQRYPETEIELDLSQQSRDLMSDGFDLALRMGPISDERLVALPLALIEEWVVVAPDQVQQLGAIETPASSTAITARARNGC